MKERNGFPDDPCERARLYIGCKFALQSVFFFLIWLILTPWFKFVLSEGPEYVFIFPFACAHVVTHPGGHTLWVGFESAVQYTSNRRGLWKSERSSMVC